MQRVSSESPVPNLSSEQRDEAQTVEGTGTDSTTLTTKQGLLPVIAIDDNRELLPPENFSMVEAGVYRSSFPRTKNIEFLKTLQLKSVLALIPEEYPVAMTDFYNQTGVKLLNCGLDGNKWPFKEIDEDNLINALKLILDTTNRPLLIHCNKGKHRTGTIIGCLRKCRGWALTPILQEYILFASPKVRFEDQMRIEAFNITSLVSDNKDSKNNDNRVLIDI